MSSSPETILLRHVRSLTAAQRTAGQTDQDLLEQFLRGHDAAAFAALVERHGAMVLGVCRSVLRHAQDAEDAFQATFLVLARRAGAIRKRRSLGSWLHGVAYRLALKARAQSARRRSRSAPPVTAAATGPLDELTVREWQAVLHEELHRLPDKYRSALLLCYWEGKTRDEAAEQLGLARGTLREHLERARNLLRSRLARRGLAPSLALFGGLLSGAASRAELSHLTAQTASAAVAFVGRAVPGVGVSARVLSLTQAMVRSMRRTKWLAMAMALALVGGLIGGLTLLAGGRSPDAAQADRGGDATHPGAAPAAAPAALKHRDEKQPGVDAFGDPLPPGAVARLGTLRFRHGLNVSTLAYSADGKKLAFAGSGNVDNTVRLADTRTGKELRTFELKASEMPEALVLSPDGGRVAVAFRDPYQVDRGGIVVWGAATGKEQRRIDCGGAPGGLAYSPDGKFFVSVDASRRMTVWDAKSGKKLRDVDVVPGASGTPVFSQDGSMLAFDSFQEKRPETVFIVDTATWAKVRQMTNPETARNWYRSCIALAFSPDGKMLAGGDSAGYVHLWNVTTGKPIEILQKEDNRITSLSFSPDGKTLAVSARLVTLWDVATRKRRHTLPVGTRVVAFSPKKDTPLLATGGESLAGYWGMLASPAVRFWDPVTGKEQAEAAPTTTVQLAAFVGGGKALSVAYGEKAYRLWDARTGKQLARVATGDKFTAAAAASRDGKLLAVSHWRGHPADGQPAQIENTIHLFDVVAGKEIQKFTGQGSSPPIGFAADGRLLVASDGLYQVAIWDTATGKLNRRLDLKKTIAPGVIAQGAVSGDGKVLTLQVMVALPLPKPDPKDEDPGSRAPEISSYCCLIDLAADKQIWRTEIVKAGEPVGAIALSPDGKVFAQAGPSSIWLRNAKTGALLHELDTSIKDQRAWQRQAGTVAFTPDGKRLIAADDRNNVYVWDVATGKGLQKHTGHRGRIFGVSTSGDNTRFATSSEDSTVVLWRLNP